MSYNSTSKSAASALTIEIKPIAAGIVVVLKGDADLPGVEEMDRKLTSILAQRPSRLIFDITQLTSISSLFMGSLVRSRNAVERAHGRCDLVVTDGLVLDALKRARLTDLFRQFNSVDAAIS